MIRLALIAVLAAGPASGIDWAEPGTVFHYDYRSERPVAASGCAADETLAEGRCVTEGVMRQQVLDVAGDVITWAEETSQPPRAASHFTIRVSQGLVVGQRYLLATRQEDGEARIASDIDIMAQSIALFPLSDDAEFQWVEQWQGPYPRSAARALTVERLEDHAIERANGPLWVLTLEEITEGSLTRFWIDPKLGWPVRIEHIYQDGEAGRVRGLAALERVAQQ